MSCAGWGIQPWGGGQCQTGMWGAIDHYPPKFLHVAPGVGDRVPLSSSIVISVSDVGCVGLDLPKTKVWINEFMAYSGTTDAGSELSIGVNQEDGFRGSYAKPGNTCTSFSVGTDTVCGNNVWNLKFCGVFYTCSSKVGISAIFYDTNGNSIKLGSGDSTVSPYTFNTIDCNYIKSVEIIDNSHYAIRFYNPMTANIDINPGLYDKKSYKVSAVSGGMVDGEPVTIKSVLVERSSTPRTVILETTPATSGARYEFTADRGLLDVYRQNLSNYGKSFLITRITKLDSIISNLPVMYISESKTERGERGHDMSLWHILAAFGIEDEKIGGNF